MLRVLLICGPLLVSILDDPKPRPDKAAALAEHAARAAKAPKTADARWRLAVWCEQQGLDAEAKAHLTEVVKLDPKRDAAWKRLGYKKVDGRWLNDDQIREAAERKTADAKWSKRLFDLHRQVHNPRNRDAAMAALGAIEDPLAVPAIYRELGRRGPGDQAIAVQVFGQIHAPAAAEALAALSLYGASADVRNRATETLRGRDPAEYAKALIAALVEPLRFEVRHVGGGGPGILFVEGDRFNIARIYDAPGVPFIPFQQNDILGIDDDGNPVLVRVDAANLGSTPIKGSSDKLMTQRRFEVRPEALVDQARRAAQSAEGQLAQDVAQVKALNAARRSINDAVLQVLRDATGQDPGPDRLSWRNWLADKAGTTRDTPPTIRKPTYQELVPAYFTPVEVFVRLYTVRLSSPPDN